MRPFSRDVFLRALPFILCTLATPALAKGPKIHSAAVGKSHPVFWTSATAPDTRLSLLIRPVIVDGRRKAWAIGDTHEVTDHSFVILEVQHLNDALPGEKLPHFIWQTANWLLVERNTGHVSVIRFTGYDPAISGISWFRDYAAFCTISANGKSLSAEVVQLGSRKPAAHKRIGSWPLKDLPTPEPPPAAPDLSSVPAPPDASAAPAPVPDTSASTATPTPAASPAKSLTPAVHPHPIHPAITATLNTGAPKPTVCTAVEWDRDPLRAMLTPRLGAPPIQLDLSLADATSTTPAPDAAQ